MKEIIQAIRNTWDQKPLILIVWLAVVTRLLSVFFAKGWGMLDDHFLVIEVAQSWADGGDVSKWLPWTPGNSGPTGHSFFYAGLHFLFFSLLNFAGMENPQARMLLVRLLHASFSLIIVVYGYRIADRIAGKNTARISGLLLAIYWFMPWLSVRNLVEVVAIPFLMLSTWMFFRAGDQRVTMRAVLLAGLLAGIAFSVRYQTIIYAGGMGLALLFRKRLRDTLLFGTGYLLAVALLQGVVDLFIWGKPFAELREYISYNLDNAYNYITGEWYNYLLLLTGALVPPLSIFLLIGFFINWRKNLLIFLPTLLFILFHSWFPNKQERFIFTIMPFLIILGIAGWQQFTRRSSFWTRHLQLQRAIWIFFWIVNLVLLFPVTTMYSKRARVEAMTHLSKYENVKSIIIENTNSNAVDIVPRFYADQWPEVFPVTKKYPLENLPEDALNGDLEPRFVLFFRNENLEIRLTGLKRHFPGLEFDTVANPSFVDKVMRWLNPHNKNESIFIYRNTKYFPVGKGS